jgi:arylformamidase
MYDLRPVRLSARSNYVTFTDEVEERFSAQRHVDKLSCPILVAHGTLETREFQRQARDFVAAVRDEGKSADLLVGEGYNHFELLETLASPYGVLGHAVLQQMALTSA